MRSCWNGYGCWFGLFYLIWMVDGREKDGSCDVKFVGYCWVLESLKMVACWACWFLGLVFDVFSGVACHFLLLC